MALSPLASLPLLQIGRSMLRDPFAERGGTQLTSIAQSFPELLANIGKSTRDALQKTDALSKEAAVGEVDPQKLALQVVNTKLAVHQLTTLVNTSVQAFQELSRMGV